MEIPTKIKGYYKRLEDFEFSSLFGRKKTKGPSSKKRKIFWYVLTVLAYVSIAYGLLKLVGSPQLLGAIRKYGIFGAILSLLIYALLGFTPVTPEPLAVADGVIFGPFWGFMINWVGYTVGAMVEFYLGKGLNKAANLRSRIENFPFGISKLPVDSWWFLILGKLTPLEGGKVANIIAGAYSVPLIKQFWSAVITAWPGALILSYGGNQIILLLHYYSHRI